MVSVRSLILASSEAKFKGHYRTSEVLELFAVLSQNFRLWKPKVLTEKTYSPKTKVAGG